MRRSYVSHRRKYVLYFAAGKLITQYRSTQRRCQVSRWVGIGGSPSTFDINRNWAQEPRNLSCSIIGGEKNTLKEALRFMITLIFAD